MKLVIADNGKLRNFEDLQMAENIVKKRRTRNLWEVIDELIKVWAERSPDEEKSILVNIDEYRESLYDKDYGTTKNGADQERRFILAFPYSLQLLIRSQYKVDELPFDKKFFHEFAKRYPAFRVAKKI